MINVFFRSALTATLALLVFTNPAGAAETTVAVAANFTEAAKEIATAFTAKTGHTAVLSFGSTGQFYTQIKQEAPFAVLLAADAETPKKLEGDGLAVPGSRYTYAIGKLVLWGKTPGVPADEATLKGGRFEKLSIANPKVAPYGAAGVQVLTRLGLTDALTSKLVQGTSIAQAFQFVDTGNAELGFVALSQVIAKAGAQYWLVPAALYDPILQDAVLLKKGEADAAARAFLAFLKGPEARKVIERYGYGLASGG
ncbi:MAG: molybdate ABC transporter substrate-binding protein [Rhodospirillaceae bacterium]